jgi:hypothetical protein
MWYSSAYVLMLAIVTIHPRMRGLLLALLLLTSAPFARAELPGVHLRVDRGPQERFYWSAEVSAATSAAELGTAAGGFVSFHEISRPFRAEAFGNFHTMGVVLDLPAGYRPRDIGEVRLYEVRPAGERRLLDPVQVGTERFYASSVFGVKPGTEYTFRAAFCNTNRQVIAARRFTGHTRREPGPIRAPAAVIHVATTGDDANPGTAQQPKRTVRAAFAATTLPGTHIILAEGTYYEGSLMAPTVGTADAPIIVKAAPGAAPILDGSLPAFLRDGWNDLGQGYFSRRLNRQPWLVAYRNRITGETWRAYPVETMAELRDQYSVYRNNPFSKFNITAAFQHDGKTLTIYCPAFSPSKSDIEMRVAAHVNGIWHADAPAVVYERLTFRFFDGRALMVENSSDVVVRNCIFRNCNVPIGLKGTSDRLLVEGSAFLDDCTRWGLNLPKTAEGYHYSGQIETGSINVYSPYNGRGLVMRHNVIDGLFDGALLVPRHYPITVKTSETDFYNNRIVHVNDDLMELDGYCRNVRVFNNRMERFLTGISIAQGVDGPTYVLYNVLGRAGDTSGTVIDHNVGYPVKTNGGTEYGPTGIAFFFHNTSWTPVPATPAFTVKNADWRRLVFANNIWYGTHTGWNTYRHAPLSPISMTTDIVWPKSGPLFHRDSGRPKDYPTIADIRASGLSDIQFLANAIVRDPLFAAPDRGDYGLRPNSPAIDAGSLIPGVNDEGFLGVAPDIGAFEYAPAGPGTIGALPAGLRFSPELPNDPSG